MSNTWDSLPGATGDAWERMCREEGDAYDRLSGTTGDAWDRLIVACVTVPIILVTEVKRLVSFISKQVQVKSNIG